MIGVNIEVIKTAYVKTQVKLVNLQTKKNSKGAAEFHHFYLIFILRKLYENTGRGQIWLATKAFDMSIPPQDVDILLSRLFVSKSLEDNNVVLSWFVVAYVALLGKKLFEEI